MPLDWANICQHELKSYFFTLIKQQPVLRVRGVIGDSWTSKRCDGTLLFTLLWGVCIPLSHFSMAFPRSSTLLAVCPRLSNVYPTASTGPHPMYCIQTSHTTALLHKKDDRTHEHPPAEACHTPHVCRRFTLAGIWNILIFIHFGITTLNLWPLFTGAVSELPMEKSALKYVLQ